MAGCTQAVVTYLLLNSIIFYTVKARGRREKMGRRRGTLTQRCMGKMGWKKKAAETRSKKKMTRMLLFSFAVAWLALALDQMWVVLVLFVKRLRPRGRDNLVVQLRHYCIGNCMYSLIEIHRPSGTFGGYISASHPPGLGCSIVFPVGRGGTTAAMGVRNGDPPILHTPVGVCPFCYDQFTLM